MRSTFAAIVALAVVPFVTAQTVYYVTDVFPDGGSGNADVAATYGSGFSLAQCEAACTADVACQTFILDTTGLCQSVESSANTFDVLPGSTVGQKQFQSLAASAPPARRMRNRSRKQAGIFAAN